MKKSLYIIMALMFTTAISKAQTGCHAMFSTHQPANSLTVHFSDSSTSAHTITTWLWDFGDGTTSTSQNPSHTYAHDGTYLVCLTIHDNHGCSNQSCHHITVNAIATPCHAAFTFHPSSASNLINFTNTSTGTTVHTTYSWTFGDGTTSTDENPHHTYTHSGHYTVCLYITDLTTGCSSHVCHSVNYHHSTGHHHHNHHHHALVAHSARTQSSTDDVTIDNNEYIVNYPNPFVSSTTIQYELTNDADVKIEIYDMLGNRISQIVNEQESEGLHTQTMNADNLNSGFYLIKMNVGADSFMKKIAVAK